MFSMLWLITGLAMIRELDTVRAPYGIAGATSVAICRKIPSTSLRNKSIPSSIAESMS